MTTIAELLAEKCAHHEASKKALPEAWRRLKVAIRELEAVEPKAIYVGAYGDNETLTVTSNFSRARQNIGIDKGWGEITITCYGRSRSRIERVRPLKELYKVSVQQGEVGFSNTDPDSSVESFHTPEELAEVAIRLYLKMA